MSTIVLVLGAWTIGSVLLSMVVGLVLAPKPANRCDMCVDEMEHASGHVVPRRIVAPSEAPMAAPRPVSV